ncbi:MAG TPA: lamin tail domain-containing protein, partial [Polyangia bacterium]|nr:lamin tail domain-containing protein [Polyangia bacterium]
AMTSELPAADAGGSSVRDAVGFADARPSGDATTDAPSGRAPRLGELMIDEVLVNPTGDDLGREWIELANRSGDWLDLSGLHLANASVDVAVAGGAIPPGGLRVLGQSADPSKNGGAPVDVAYGTKLILGNADGEVSICLGACASGLMLDTVAWGTLDDDTVGHALVVDPLTKAICAASTPFGTGGSFGTPGLPNPPCGEDAGVGGAADAAVR